MTTHGEAPRMRPTPSRPSTTALVTLTALALLVAPLAASQALYTPQPDQRLADASNPSFGEAVALDGTTLAVDGGGHVDVYQQQADNTWTHTQEIGDHSYPPAFELDNRYITMGAPGIDELDIYRETASGWTLHQTLTSPSGGDDNFGISASLDNTTLAIGADSDDSAATGAGAAYVYEYNTSTDAWEKQTKLLPAGLAKHASFGRTLALDGDTLVISAPDNDTAYVYERVNGSWTQTAKLSPETVSASALFADTVATDGTTIAISAPETTVLGNEEAGAVYLYTNTNGDWTLAQTLTNPTATPDAWFGTSVAFDNTNLVVGAPRDHVAGQLVGAVHLFTKQEDRYVYTERLAPNHSSDVGRSLAADNGTILAGSPGENFPDGAAYVWNAIAQGHGNGDTGCTSLTTTDGTRV